MLPDSVHCLISRDLLRHSKCLPLLLPDNALMKINETKLKVKIANLGRRSDCRRIVTNICYVYTSPFPTALRCLGILLTSQQLHCTEAFICLWFQLTFLLFALFSQSAYPHNAIALGKVFAAILLSILIIKLVFLSPLFICILTILLLLSLSKPRIIMVHLGNFPGLSNDALQ